MSVINLFDGITSLSILLFLIATALNFSFVFMRMFPLSVQDRLIRSEENFRMYLLTGKLLDPNITIPQIIALRFASDEEFVALAERALKENMSSKQIKQAIKQWRADYARKLMKRRNHFNTDNYHVPSLKFPEGFNVCRIVHHHEHTTPLGSKMCCGLGGGVL
ncbi:MAG: hypothetical protein IPM69_07035 [Ignavibacteria bacterium]|nr:hypothetical protein [Ignavibacteria bacterium]